MNDQEQLLAAIEKSNKAFEDFKTLNEAKLKSAESRADELKSNMQKAFDDMAGQKTVIETLQAKLTGRPGNGGTAADDQKEHVEAHRKAYSGPGGFLRKGVEAGLRDLEMKALNTVSGVDGGFAVPKVIETEIENFVVNISPVRGVSRVVQISTPDYHKLVNLRGTGSGWVGETDARPETNTPTLEDVAPPMGELYANPQASQTMLDDVFFNAESWLAEEVGTEFARQEGNGFILGNGIKKPRGFLTYTNVTTADATRAFGSIQYTKSGAAADWATATTSLSQTDCLIALVGTIKAPYRQNARFMMCKGILFDIAAMKDPTGRYVFNPISAPGVPQTVLNYPIVEAEDMPAKAANAYSVAFADFRRAYLIVDRIGTRVLRDPFTNKPYIAFYTTKRLGGGVVNSEAIKLLKFEA